MQFALIGAHPAGVEAACALVSWGEFVLAAYAGPEWGAARLQSHGLRAERFSDPEALLALPRIELVIIADELADRPQSLRRAVQSEKHVLCVYPPDLLPDVTYEVAMIQQETQKILLPILPARLSPAVEALRTRLGDGTLGSIQLVHWEIPLRRSTDQGPAAWESHPLLTLWDVLRALGGEITDVAAAGAEMEELRPEDTLTLTGHFTSAGLFRVLLTPGDAEATERLHLRGDPGEAELTRSTAGLRVHVKTPAHEHSQEWADWNEGDAIAEELAARLSGREPRLVWQDATRCLELYEAVRQSVKRRRVVPMHYEEFTETSTFKGTMAALGCGVLVIVVLVIIGLLAFRVPLRWPVLLVILPLLAVFLGLQLLRWLVPSERK